MWFCRRNLFILFLQRGELVLVLLFAFLNWGLCRRNWSWRLLDILPQSADCVCRGSCTHSPWGTVGKKIPSTPTPTRRLLEGCSWSRELELMQLWLREPLCALPTRDRSMESWPEPGASPQFFLQKREKWKSLFLFSLDDPNVVIKVGQFRYCLAKECLVASTPLVSVGQSRYPAKEHSGHFQWSRYDLPCL